LIAATYAILFFFGVIPRRLFLRVDVAKLPKTAILTVCEDGVYSIPTKRRAARFVR
jgi:hypothetical protein